jgi:hypothetical protein
VSLKKMPGAGKCCPLSQELVVSSAGDPSELQQERQQALMTVHNDNRPDVTSSICHGSRNTSSTARQVQRHVWSLDHNIELVRYLYKASAV